MDLEKLFIEINKKYKKEFLGSTGTDNVMGFHFNVNGSNKSVYIPTSENNEEILEKIEMLLNESEENK